jgi:Prp8 binding protein
MIAFTCIQLNVSLFALSHQSDTITCLSLNPKGTHLLSNSMDGTLKTWDIRPFVDDAAGKKRHDKTFTGGTHNAEKGLLNCAWSADGSMVTGGSADRIVHIWDELSAEELYCLPGHAGCVNSVIFHPKENVIASASSDKTIYVGELS